jgi:hypothetical protein
LLKRNEDVEFVAPHGVFEAAEPVEHLRAEALAGDDFPAQAAGLDFGAWE